MLFLKKHKCELNEEILYLTTYVLACCDVGLSVRPKIPDVVAQLLLLLCIYFNYNNIFLFLPLPLV